MQPLENPSDLELQLFSDNSPGRQRPESHLPPFLGTPLPPSLLQLCRGHSAEHPAAPSQFWPKFIPAGGRMALAHSPRADRIWMQHIWQGTDNPISINHVKCSLQPIVEVVHYTADVISGVSRDLGMNHHIQKLTVYICADELYQKVCISPP